MKTPTHVWRESDDSRGRRVEKVAVFGAVVVDDEVIGYIEDCYFEGDDNVIIDANSCWLTKKEALAAVPKRHGGRRKGVASFPIGLFTGLLKERYADKILEDTNSMSGIGGFMKGKVPEGKTWALPIKTEVTK